MPNPDNMDEVSRMEDAIETEGESRGEDGQQADAPAEYDPDSFDPDRQPKKKRALSFFTFLLFLIAIGAAGGVFGGRY
ncbi:MAG: hypothetical protein FWH49_08395, partial [Clostridiales bacterium]|nr:hypothetical protein [Clostridiales bacterium]